AGGEPQPTVAGEALLRGEVVHVDVGRVPQQAAGGGGRVDGDERVAGRPAQLHGDAGGRLVVRQGDEVDALGGCGDQRVVARVAAHDDRLAEVRRGGRRLGELGGELAEHGVLAALADQP